MKNILFKTSRLIIRNLRDSDLISFQAYRSDPEITKYQGFDPFTIQDSMDFIRLQKDKTYGVVGEWIQYGIETIRDHRLIGDCAIHLKIEDPRIAELGITISGGCQQMGYAKEVMTGLMDFLFQKEIHRIVETVDTKNQASIQLLKSLSFRQEGHFIENIFFKGKWGSEYQFAMLKKEWDLLNLSIFRNPDSDTI